MNRVGDGRLFFTGAATTRSYLATMHGAFLSGLREAAIMAYYDKAEDRRVVRKEIERSPSTYSHSCASLLANLSQEPDLEFGSFSIIFYWKNSAPKSTIILRVSLPMSFRGYKFPSGQLRLLSILAYLFAIIVCSLPLSGAILNEEISIKVAVEILSFPGAILLMFYTFKGYKSEASDGGIFPITFALVDYETQEITIEEVIQNQIAIVTCCHHLMRDKVTLKILMGNENMVEILKVLELAASMVEMQVYRINGMRVQHVQQFFSLIVERDGSESNEKKLTTDLSGLVTGMAKPSVNILWFMWRRRLLTGLQGSRRDILREGSLGIAISCLLYHKLEGNTVCILKSYMNYAIRTHQPSFTSNEDELNSNRIQQFVNHHTSDPEDKGTSPTVPKFYLNSIGSMRLHFSFAWICYDSNLFGLSRMGLLLIACHL